MEVEVMVVEVMVVEEQVLAILCQDLIGLIRRWGGQGVGCIHLSGREDHWQREQLRQWQRLEHSVDLAGWWENEVRFGRWG